MKNGLVSKVLVCAILILFVSISNMPLAGSLSVERASIKEQIYKSNLAGDTTPPDIELTWEAFKEGRTWYVKFTALCNDTSGIDRVEWALDDVVEYIDHDSPYEWTIEWAPILGNPTFKATAFDKAGNSAFDTVKYSELIFPVIVVHVNEIYGTVDDPQYRPLANVTVEIKSSLFGIFWCLWWDGTTDGSGTTEQVEIPGLTVSLLSPTSCKVTVSKDGYHTYGCLPSKIVKTTNLGRYDVDFTMAEDGSPFVQQISQGNQQSNQLLQMMTKITNR
jgi:hypothetical protein